MKIPNACKDLCKQPNVIIICFQERVKALNESMNLKMKLGFCPTPESHKRKGKNHLTKLFFYREIIKTPSMVNALGVMLEISPEVSLWSLQDTSYGVHNRCLRSIEVLCNHIAIIVTKPCSQNTQIIKNQERKESSPHAKMDFILHLIENSPAHKLWCSLKVIESKLQLQTI